MRSSKALPNYAFERVEQALARARGRRGGHSAPAARGRAHRAAAQRERYGAKAGMVLLLVALSMWATLAFALEISVRQLGENHFEAVLTNPTSLSEDQARAHIASTAASVCKNRIPVLGEYEFEAKQPVGSGVLARDSGSFRFTQEVTCSLTAPSSSGVRHPTLKSPDEAQSIQNDIKRKSEAYFRLLAAKLYDEAYAEVSGPALGTDQAKWSEDNQAFQTIAGEPIAVSVVRVTVYDNPEEAPEPGLYVAADFSNIYANVPIHCGYLMWFRPISDSEFKITRLETGYVTSEQLKTIPSNQLPEIKQKLRCVAP